MPGEGGRVREPEEPPAAPGSDGWGSLHLPAPSDAGAGDLGLAVGGEIVAEYSPDAPVWSETLGQWQTHPALDIAGSPGEAVYACRDGVVSEAWKDRLWGNVILVEHDDGYQSTYAGLNTLNMVAIGDAREAWDRSSARWVSPRPARPTGAGTCTSN